MVEKTTMSPGVGVAGDGEVDCQKSHLLIPNRVLMATK